MPNGRKRDDSVPQGSTEVPTRFKGFLLSAFQLQAVRAIEEGHDVLLSAPTGAGKTLVAEYAIQKSVERGRRCIYTAPIKALSNQKYRDFRDDPNIDVGLMTGDVTIHPGAQVLIMTTEILRNSMLEDPASLADVEYVIFDEVHYMDDPERGTVWEESLIFAPRSMRFICLSATIDNLGQLGAWIREIREHELTIVSSTKRPVPLKHRFFLADYGLFDEHTLPRVRKQFAEAAAEGKRGGAPRRRLSFEQRMAQREETRRAEAGGFSHLLDELVAQGQTPVLAFCFSRKDCERLALANRRRDLLNDEERVRMDTLLRDTMAAFQLDEKQMIGELFRLCARGIAYHHAGMLPVHKEVVERLFTSGLLKLLFTTETFAVGINMPARTVTFFSLRKFDGESFDYLRTRDYMQMAGRAGRQGIDKEGLVVSRLDPKDLTEAPLERLVRGKPEPIESRFRLSYSAILHLIEELGRERLFEAWQKSFNQFQHREGGKKVRERNAALQRRFLDGLVGFLHQSGFLESADRRDVLTPKAKVARTIYGFELQVAEWLWRGVYEELDAAGLATLFVGLVFEDRRRFNESTVPQRLYGGARRHAAQIIGRLAHEEAQFDIPVPIKQPDWGLTEAVVAWMRGATFEELSELVDIPGGDICRCFRMAVQVMRQLRSSVDQSYDLSDRLKEAMAALGRDEVDARRQLELG